MTGSMYASVAGLKAHMQKLTVIGNNVANVNTQGYKKQRTVFRDSLYSMYSAGSNGSISVGGMNPSQLGYGSLVGSIDLNMSSATYNPGNPTDCALVGDGFFVVGSKDVEDSTNPMEYNANTFTADNIKALNLTRVGDFSFKGDSYLTDAKGNIVYGFMATSDIETVPGPNGQMITRHVISDQLVPIRLPRWDEDHVIKYARTDVQVTRDANGQITGGTVVTDGTAAQRLEDDRPIFNVDATAGGDDAPDPADQYEFAVLDSITIDAGTGCISGTHKETGENVVIGYIAVANVTNPNGVTHIGNSYYQCKDGAGAMSISMLGNVHEQLGISHIGASRLAAADGDDDAPDYLPGSDVVGAGSTEGSTEMMVGFLEGPNVDLAEEITELITTQRGYQANTRIITVTDSMLEELVNMKR